MNSGLFHVFTLLIFHIPEKHFYKIKIKYIVHSHIMLFEVGARCEVGLVLCYMRFSTL
jgi:hypothetical protein